MGTKGFINIESRSDMRPPTVQISMSDGREEGYVHMTLSAKDAQTVLKLLEAAVRRITEPEVKGRVEP